MIVLDGSATARATTLSRCADALESALLADFPAEPDPPRHSLRLAAGELLLMPSRVTGVPTTKLVTIVDPGGPPPRIKGVHIVFDPASLEPVAVLDAAALTVSRTAAVSLVAMRRLVRTDARRAVVFGAGPQAAAHVEAFAAEWPARVLTVVGRTPHRLDRFAEGIRADHPHLDVTVLDGGQEAPAVADAVSAADLVVCATTATEPLFESNAARPGCAFVAIGSHTATARELPGELVASSFVVVEDRATALREAGDVAVPVAQGLLDPDAVAADLAGLVRDPALNPADDATRVFKSVGMAWQDAVVSAEVVRRVRCDGRESELGAAP